MWQKHRESFFATARMELSIFGCVMSQHSEKSTPEHPVAGKVYFLLISDTLDHTGTRANHCIDLCLEQRNMAAELHEVNILSDAAGHFKSFESMYHHCVHLVQQLKVPVRTHFGCEKHMKAECDQLFGWMELALQWAKRKRCIVTTMEDLKKLLLDYIAERRQQDPSSPCIKILVDTSNKPQYGRRLLHSTGDFQITRTYCFSGIPASTTYSYIWC